MTSRPPLARVRKAYEQIADQLRNLIVTGQIASGEKLPTESDLATSLGVSRATVREALRILAAENLIRTEKGPTGGSFVVRPSTVEVAEYLSTNLTLLSRAEDISLDDLLQAREMIESPAARLAAETRHHDQLPALAATLHPNAGEMGYEEEFVLNREFHSCLLDLTGNALLKIAVQPMFVVLQSHLARSGIRKSEQRSINEYHEKIEAAIRAGDGDAAEAQMAAHLEALRPIYRRVWKTIGAEA